jgi:hypothetical protein
LKGGKHFMKTQTSSVLKISSRAWSVALVAAFAGSVPACETDTPTTAQVENALSSAGEPGGSEPSLTVYRVWYKETLFIDPILPGEMSPPQRIVPGSDYAYALAAVDWDASAGGNPDRLIALRSEDKLPIERGGVLSIRVQNATFVGNCWGDRPLSQEGADFIAERIFSAEFAGTQYDAATCTTVASGGGGAGGFGGAGPP